jgi:hypothetical protein
VWISRIVAPFAVTAFTGAAHLAARTLLMMARRYDNRGAPGRQGLDKSRKS